MSKRLTIHLDETPIYDIVIEQDFSKLAEEMNRLGLNHRKICIVCDSNSAKYHLAEAKEALQACEDVSIIDYVFPAGEENKTLDTVRNLYEALILAHFERKDLLVALGGGVVGDLTGYTAATYLRGIDFVQVPTTLLSMADSSIGGKTGVDFDAYKNMVGAFHMPKLVYMNMNTLTTLDHRIYISGFGEIIKHAYIKNKDLLDLLIQNQEKMVSCDPVAMEEIIFESCKIKGDVVRRDPKEKGERMLLNFGHTLGHAIEKLSGFQLYHGECVVLGMICALTICKNRGMITEQDVNTAVKIFKDYGFPTTISGIASEEILKASKSDKKMNAGQIRFILLNQIGEGVITYDVTDEEMLQSCNSLC